MYEEDVEEEARIKAENLSDSVVKIQYISNKVRVEQIEKLLKIYIREGHTYGRNSTTYMNECTSRNNY